MPCLASYFILVIFLWISELYPVTITLNGNLSYRTTGFVTKKFSEQNLYPFDPLSNIHFSSISDRRNKYIYLVEENCKKRKYS